MVHPLQFRLQIVIAILLLAIALIASSGGSNMTADRGRSLIASDSQRTNESSEAKVKEVVFSRRRCSDKEAFFREMGAAESLKKQHLSHKFCNKVNCGHWDLKNRHWTPYGCIYQDFTADNAQACMKGKTLAFIGDSIIRDIAIGLMYYLEGIPIEQASDTKFDRHFLDSVEDNAFKALFNKWIRFIPALQIWNKTVVKADNPIRVVNTNVGKENGFVYINKNGIQIQYWGMFYKAAFTSNLKDILNNEARKQLPWLNKIDIAFLHIGLHNVKEFSQKPYGISYLSNVIKPWLDVRAEVATPSVWSSFNNNCLGLLIAKNSQKWIDFDLQRDIVESANSYINNVHSEHKFPYWDASSVLRSPQRCNVSADGLHVKMWVDMVRANMLLNHLCDQSYSWNGSPDRFL